MADQNSFPQTETKAQDPELCTHSYNDPHISAKEFMLRVMHDRDVPIKDRLNAASKLLRIYGEHEFAPPTCKVIIGGIPDSYLQGHGSCSGHPREGDRASGSTGNDSQNREIAQIAITHSGEDQGPINMEMNSKDLSFEQILQTIRTMDLDNLPLCECGHRMPFPCRPVKIQ